MLFINETILKVLLVMSMAISVITLLIAVTTRLLYLLAKKFVFTIINKKGNVGRQNIFSLTFLPYNH